MRKKVVGVGDAKCSAVCPRHKMPCRRKNGERCRAPLLQQRRAMCVCRRVRENAVRRKLRSMRSAASIQQVRIYFIRIVIELMVVRPYRARNRRDERNQRKPYAQHEIEREYEREIEERSSARHVKLFMPKDTTSEYTHNPTARGNEAKCAHACLNWFKTSWRMVTPRAHVTKYAVPLSLPPPLSHHAQAGTEMLFHAADRIHELLFL